MNNDACYGSAGLTVLLEKGASVNERNEDGATPLLIAFQNEVCKGFTRPVQNLMEHKEDPADPTITDNRQRSCLHYAARSHNMDACRKLLPRSKQDECSKRVNLKDHHGETPLHWACKANAPRELIKIFLRRGADLGIKDNKQQTPLYGACRRGNEAVVRLLLGKGADIHDRDANGDTVSSTIHFRTRFHNSLIRCRLFTKPYILGTAVSLNCLFREALALTIAMSPHRIPWHSLPQEANGKSSTFSSTLIGKREGA